MDPVLNRALARVTLLGALALAGCSHERVSWPESSPTSAEAPIAVTRTTSATVPAAHTAQAGLNISSEIVEACKLHFGNVDAAPKFDFDKSELRQDERGVLDQIASCVTTGPLKGRALRLVGRADPRGEEEYNFALGESRAGSVRSYLAGLGVDAAKIAATSRGELDAIGSDEAGWQRDRRVDVDLQ